MKTVLFFILSIISVLSYAQAELISLSTEKFDDSVQIWATNLTHGSVSLQLSYPRLVNMKSVPEKPYLTIKAGEKVKAAVITAINQAAGYSYSFSYLSNVGAHNAKPDDILYDLPFQKGVSSIVGQGYHGKHSHQGEFAYSLDFDMPVGTVVTAAREGVVIEVMDKNDGAGLTQYHKEHANYVKIEHSDGTIAEYVHIKKGGAIVTLGSIVEKNEAIAYSGNVGYSDGPHLHFDVFMLVDGQFQTIPVKFNTAEGENLLQGKTYKSQ